jgi:hypothetical protein
VVDDVYVVAKHLGGIVAQARSVMPALATAAVKSAKAGEIDENDVNSIYGIYIRASLETDKVDHTSNTFKANASKLRTIVKCALDHDDALDLLKRMTEAHAKVKYRLSDVPSLYDAMVMACRTYMQRGKLTTEDINGILYSRED